MNEIDYVSIAALNQYSYCPHRCWRMFCAGEFSDNQYTIEGTSLHERVHTMGEVNRDETWQVRAIWLKSERYQLIGKSDLIESAEGKLYPVEYKRGKKGEWDNDELQVCAQALCLEEMTGQTITQGYVYYAQSHPVLGKKCTYQEAFEIQARLLAKYLMGEIEQYPPLVLR